MHTGVGDPSVVLQVLKQRVARRGLKLMGRAVSSPNLSRPMGKDGAPPVLQGERSKRQFWQRRFYDFNVSTQEKHVEKLRYMHRNPVKRGLVTEPGDWPWSSFRHYAYREIGVVEVESEWTARDRELKMHGGPTRIFLLPPS